MKMIVGWDDAFARAFIAWRLIYLVTDSCQPTTMFIHAVYGSKMAVSKDTTYFDVIVYTSWPALVVVGLSHTFLILDIWGHWPTNR